MNGAEVQSQPSMDVYLSPVSNPFHLTALQKELELTQKYSQFSWTQITEEKWVLSMGHRETLILEKCSQGNYNWIVTLRKAIHKRVTSDQIILVHDSLQSAFQASDTFVTKKLGYHRSRSLTPGATWRHLPPTESQSRLLQIWGLGWSGINRGDASALLSKRMNGSLSHSASKINSEKRRHARSSTTDACAAHSE